MGVLVGVAFLALAGFGLGAFVILFNGLVKLRRQVDKAWANIDVILRQRHDEIPQLIEVIQQYVKLERGILDGLVEGRSRYGSAKSTGEKVAAAQQLSVALNGAIALGEAYPDLKSNRNFMQLQKRISELENLISDRREWFNEAVTVFNTRIEQIPDRFFAGMLGYQSMGLFQAAPLERERPSLKMGLTG